MNKEFRVSVLYRCPFLIEEKEYVQRFLLLIFLK